MEFSDFNFAGFARSSVQFPGCPNPVWWRPLLPKVPHCPPTSKGGVFILLCSAFLAPICFRKETFPLPTSHLSRNSGRLRNTVSCPPPVLFTLWSPWRSPLREPKIRDLEHAQPASKTSATCDSPAQANCSDTPTGQEGYRMVKDTGLGAGCCVGALHPT